MLLKTLKQNPGAPENAVKLQGERRWVQGALADTLEGLAINGSVQPLLSHVHAEEAKQRKLNQTVVGEREVWCRSHVITEQLHRHSSVSRS